jgi:hypothetical protein
MSRHPVVQTSDGHTAAVAPEHPSTAAARHQAFDHRIEDHGGRSAVDAAVKTLPAKHQAVYADAGAQPTTGKNKELNCKLRRMSGVSISTPEETAALIGAGVINGQ